MRDGAHWLHGERDDDVDRTPVTAFRSNNPSASRRWSCRFCVTWLRSRYSIKIAVSPDVPAPVLKSRFVERNCACNVCEPAATSTSWINVSG
jgi:hypothetical protein